MVRSDRYSGNFGPPDQFFRRTKISVTVPVVLTPNTHASNTDSYTAQLDFNNFVHIYIISARFTIDNGTFGMDNFQEPLRWWGTGSSCYRGRAPVCPSVPQLGYATGHVAVVACSTNNGEKRYSYCKWRCCVGGMGTRLQVMHERSRICRFAHAKLHGDLEIIKQNWANLRFLLYLILLGQKTMNLLTTA